MTLTADRIAFLKTALRAVGDASQYRSDYIPRLGPSDAADVLAYIAQLEAEAEKSR